jgi:tRNA dimethylallyltransferase
MTTPIQDAIPLVIAGPTASGKSKLAIDYCLKRKAEGARAEILCADSITIYKGFDIGAAKPSSEERALVPHHLVDIRNWDEDFTAADFTKIAHAKINELSAAGVQPVIVGGTGFYLRALLRGMTEQEDSPESLAIKARLEKRLASEGPEALYKEMLMLDPALAKKIHLNDHYRIVRALQAMEITGKSWSKLNEEAKSLAPRYAHFRYFCLDLPREVLRERVTQRTEAMLAAGLMTEVESLLEQGVSPDCKPMQSVGYKECIDCLAGKYPPAELATQIIQSTMQLAKRQMTWWRGEKNLGIEWVQPEQFMVGSDHEK